MSRARFLLRMVTSRPLPIDIETGNPSGVRTSGATSTAEALPTDQTLLDRMAVRDADAFAQFYDRHAAVTFATAVHLLGDAAAAERAVEQTFLTIWRQAAGPEDARVALRTRLLVLVCRYAWAARHAADSADA